MVIEFIKDYTRKSGRTLKAGSLGEYDSETANNLISEGYAKAFATGTNEVGCTKMTQNRHLLLGMNSLISEFDTTEEE